MQRPRVENRNRRDIKQRSTSQKWVSLQLRPPLSLGWRRISGQEFWSVCGCVCVEVFNRVGGEHGDLASSELACTNKGNACIWYSSLCTVHTQTHTHTHSLLLSLICFLSVYKVLGVLVHIIACCSSTYLVSPLQTLTSKIKIFTTDTTQWMGRAIAKLISLFYQK